MSITLSKKETKPLIVVITGPTSSGKSDLAVKLAKKYNGEIISADSRQIYRGMNIGTGKVTKNEMGKIPHHLLDIVSPRVRYDVSRWKRKADTTIKQVLKKNKLPIICGGTGLYIKALTENISYPDVKPDMKLRANLEKITTEKLFKILEKKDDLRAKNIDKYNRRRLIRALEIVMSSKAPVPNKNSHQNYNSLILGISIPKDILRKKITLRLHKRIRKGMVQEVSKLHKLGLSWKRLSEIGLEYRYVSLYLQEKLTKEEMITQLNTKIGHYAKRQMTWFRKTPHIHWIHTQQEAEKLIKPFLKQEV